jgi:hypothetical protein
LQPNQNLMSINKVSAMARLLAGWPDEFGEKITQNVAQRIFWPKFKHKRNSRITEPKMWYTSAIFQVTAQSKQLPIGRKFAQSGHPDCNKGVAGEGCQKCDRSL